MTTVSVMHMMASVVHHKLRSLTHRPPPYCLKIYLHVCQSPLPLLLRGALGAGHLHSANKGGPGHDGRYGVFCLEHLLSSVDLALRCLRRRLAFATSLYG